MAKPKVRIVFCEGCKWALRAGWYAQELFSTFHGKLSSVELVVGESGQFQVWLDDTRLWDRKVDDGFPDAADLKRRIRDAFAPDVSLGHCDLPERGE
ncbi:SelT/SelW/SelH family protein [Thalassolituus sp. LLYu03]|uniref:SelT/SelW/SelH family protein n=1 Tax=Thalassolituus sp. LLYu03 TaxID=3421656 RepID=UPI003D2E3511